MICVNELSPTNATERDTGTARYHPRSFRSRLRRTVGYTGTRNFRMLTPRSRSRNEISERRYDQLPSPSATEKHASTWV